MATAGSFSAAGRALGLSQTMVTKHIAALEVRLGVKLFHRTTPAAVDHRSRAAVSGIVRAHSGRHRGGRQRGGGRIVLKPRGVLRLNVPVSFGSRQIAPMLSAFTRQHPQVTVELGLNDRFVNLAEEGWDLAIRIGSLSDSSLIARRIAPCRTVVCAAPSYLVTHGTPRVVRN